MTFQPSTAEVDAAERELLDADPTNRANNPPDGYWRPLAEAIAIAIHEARETMVREATMSSDPCIEHKRGRDCPVHGPLRPTHLYEDDDFRCAHCSASAADHPAMPAALVVDASTHRETDDEQPSSLIEIIVGPCGRSEAETACLMVQEFMDKHFPSLGAACGVRFSLTPTPEQAQERAFALAVDSLHLIASDQAEGGDQFEAEGTLKQINEQMGGDPNRMYRLPNARSSQ